MSQRPTGRRRAIGGTLVWLVLAAAVATLGNAAAPAGAQTPPIDEPDPNAFIPVGPPRINPALEPNNQCGLDIAIVIDLSNSIDDTELAQLKSAASGFVTALEGTPSNIGVFNFATFAPANTSAANAPLVFQTVATGAGATAARAKINGLTRPASANGGTNWDRGLGQVTDSGQEYDGVLFLTDGDPTAHGIPGNPGVPVGNSDFGTGVDQIDVDSAVASANVLKDVPTRIVAVGIGTGASPGSVQRLQAISGPTENVDYFLTNFAELGAALRELASGSCDALVTVKKVIRASDGTTSPGAGWTFTSAGTGVTPASATTQSGGTVSFQTDFTTPTDPERVITLTETAQPGFEIVVQPSGEVATCTTREGAAVPTTRSGPTGFEVTVAPLDAITCTVVNAVLTPPRLTLVKQVTNDDGGTAAPGAWTLSATGPTTVTGASGTPAVTDVAVAPGTYALAESAAPAGYTAGPWACTAGTLTGTSLTLDYGDSATCTIVNDDIAPTLTLVKTLVQDPTSPVLPTAWTLTATGPTPITGATGSPTVTAATVSAGAYALTESGPDGFQLAGWSCTGAPLAGTTVTIPLAAAVTCTATNAATPSWTLAKSSTPTSGTTVVPGGQVTYTLTATNTSNATVTGIDVTDDLDDVLDDATLVGGSIVASAGTAQLTGTSLEWTIPSLAANQVATVSYAVTVGASSFGATLRNVATGDAAVPPTTCGAGSTDCSTTHPTPLAPRLTLVKTVTNDDGGTAGPADFVLSAAGGTTTVSGPSGDPAVTDAPVDVGTYTLAESGPDGYEASAWACVGGIQAGDQVTLGFGETATCTIVNDDIAPTLTLVKALDQPAGSPVQPDEWTLTATGPTPISGPSGDPAVTDAEVGAGSYALGEAGPAGYELVSWACTGGTLTGATVVVPLDTAVTCTATNRPLPFDLQIEKLHRVTGTTDDRNVVVGTGDTFDYDITVRNAGPGPATTVVVSDVIPSTLAVDPASIVAPAGWTVGVTGQDAGGFGGRLTAAFPGPLAPGASVTISLTVTVGPLPQPDPAVPPAAIVNTTTVTGDGPDGTPDDNTSTETTPVKAVTLTAAGVCRNNLPFLDYAIGAVGFTPTVATVNWFSVATWNNGAPTGPPSATSAIPVDQLVGSLLWPGAAVDAAGNPTDWPGWTLRPDGTWIEDPNAPGADLRPATVVQVVVNPTVATAEVYPPADPVCDPNPPRPAPPPAGGGGGGAATGSGGGTSRGRLPRTGADVAAAAVAAAGLLAAGTWLVGAGRGRRRPWPARHTPAHLARRPGAR